MKYDNEQQIYMECYHKLYKQVSKTIAELKEVQCQCFDIFADYAEKLANEEYKDIEN